MSRDAGEEKKNTTSFEEWVCKMERDYPSCSNPEEYGWRRIDEEWLVSTRENSSYYQKAFHICRSSWQESGTIIGLDEVCECGEVVPEGLRMVALLLEAL